MAPKHDVAVKIIEASIGHDSGLGFDGYIGPDFPRATGTDADFKEIQNLIVELWQATVVAEMIANAKSPGFHVGAEIKLEVVIHVVFQSRIRGLEV